MSTTRALLSDDGRFRVYEVRDDAGLVVGTDTEPVAPAPPDAVQDIAEALAALPPATLAALRAALGI